MFASYPDIIRSVADGKYEWARPAGFTYCLIFRAADAPPVRSTAAPTSPVSGLIVEPKRPAQLVDDADDLETWFVRTEVEIEIGSGREDVLRSATMTVEERADGSASDYHVYTADEFPPGWEGEALLPGEDFPSPCFETWAMCFILPRAIEPTVVTLRVRFVGGKELAFELPVKKAALPRFGFPMSKLVPQPPRG
jgi:hypothetical protein